MKADVVKICARWDRAGVLTNESFNDWAAGHPEDGMKIAVMDFSNMGRWFSSLAFPCLPFCEKLQETTPPTTKSPGSTSTTTDQVQNTLGNRCASPWVQLSDSCYLEALEDVGSWFDGEKFCHDQGGYLLEVNSRQEQDRLAGDFCRFVNQSRSK